MGSGQTLAWCYNRMKDGLDMWIYSLSLQDFQNNSRLSENNYTLILSLFTYDEGEVFQIFHVLSTKNVNV